MAQENFKLKPIIVSTSPIDWTKDELALIHRVMNQAKFCDVIEPIVIDYELIRREHPQTYTRPDGKRMFSWSWFTNNITNNVIRLFPSKNMIAWHMQEDEKIAWGVTPTFGGAYFVDKNTIMECWLEADVDEMPSRHRTRMVYDPMVGRKVRITERVRIFLHEAGHAVTHFSGRRKELAVQLGIKDDTLITHHMDYVEKDVGKVFQVVSFENWSLQKYVISLATQVIGLLKRNIAAQNVETNREKLHKAARAALGSDASPNDAAPDELGCADTVSNILRKVIPFPIITGTWTLDERFRTDKRFELVTSPLPGDIIISPTATGNGSIVGHVGIVGENDIIMSNDSFQDGHFLENFTMKSWEKRYKDKGGFPIRFFRLKRL